MRERDPKHVTNIGFTRTLNRWSRKLGGGRADGVWGKEELSPMGRRRRKGIREPLPAEPTGLAATDSSPRRKIR